MLNMTNPTPAESADAAVDTAVLVDADDVAVALQVTPTTVRRWAREGRIPHVRLTDGCVRFSPIEVAEWVSEQTRKVQP